MTEFSASTASRTGPARGIASPQTCIAGLLLIALAGLAFWLTADLPRGTLRSAGPGMLPQALTVLIALSGVILTITGVMTRGAAMPLWSLRGPLCITLAIACFALTIKPMSLGSLTTPELGLVVAGPLTIFLGGYAAPGARFRPLLLLALTLTPLCMLLFGDMLNLPIPLLPQALAESLFADWSYKGALRLTAAALLSAALAVFLLTRNWEAR
ncbi:hypothetical protein VZ95_13370 [Elstera litoralis]|uniref:DUF1468 domain-containing protein n=1 Tax=Elstera litoralis TaxID=552518 RepID=A0A0F3IRH2_9PROT|nr:tripartite tricarboxylate transporter TctB family protein [Elstera litoralis]KJV09138.1 hypothetical protein VZ95_13370 [Elstera litoralis]